ncbi:MAG: hypothetical protein WCE61_22000 [Candidatus Acidiferrum sp.]
MLTQEEERCRPEGTALRKTILAGGEEGEEAEVAEDLELLADFVADVGVVGMELGKLGGVGVDVGWGEFGFVQGADDVEDVEGPAAGFGF